MFVLSMIYIYFKVYKCEETLCLTATFVTMPVRKMGSVIILV